MQLDLQQTEWDACVVGNGVAALWLSHWLWSSKKSVLWITSEDPYSPERALLQHAWQWGLSNDSSEVLMQQLQGFEVGEGCPEFELIYFDARSSTKRFKRYAEAKKEWGTHEKEYFDALTASLAEAGDKPLRDLWHWHSRLHRFHDAGSAQTAWGPTMTELFSEPRFVRVQGYPLLELKTEKNRLSHVVLSGLKKTETIEINAKQFFLGDFDEPLPALVKEHADSESLAAALKRKAFRAGFGLRLWHGTEKLETYPVQTAVIPLLVNPSEKGAASHVIGRFNKAESGELESLWVGFLTDEELEDNNEILKKIKLTKRAIDRAVPGFSNSIQRESVTFEPRMRGTELVKGRKVGALGAGLISDYFGPETAAQNLKGIFEGPSAKTESAKAPRERTRPREPEVGV